jgi:hypothetical protein
MPPAGLQRGGPPHPLPAAVARRPAAHACMRHGVRCGPGGRSKWPGQRGACGDSRPEQWSRSCTLASAGASCRLHGVAGAEGREGHRRSNVQRRSLILRKVAREACIGQGSPCMHHSDLPPPPSYESCGEPMLEYSSVPLAGGGLRWQVSTIAANGDGMILARWLGWS